MNLAPAEALSRLLEVLDRLEIQYMLGESLASAAYGLWRSMWDIDIVADIAVQEVESLIDRLRHNFYIDAIEYGRRFSVIHLSTSYKFNIFPLTSDAYEQTRFGRRTFDSLPTAEDVILSKLRSYGQRPSEQDWNDVLGVIAVQCERLDLPYLREWARYLKVHDLLEQSLAERHEPLS